MSAPAKPSLLIAFGGNALNPPEGSVDPASGDPASGDPASRDRPDHKQKDEFDTARKSMQTLVPLIKQGYDRIILTHGNGPQVGRIFRQQELTLKEFPRQVTLDVCVADSQGRIGYILQNVFDNVCAENQVQKRSSSIITQVIVDPNDPAFANPTKPIGVFYTPEDAEEMMRQHGWIMKEDSGRGFRRVVPSPEPLDIVEKQLFHDILGLGFIVIGAGGGGIPVTRDERGELHGVEAVIDKDKTSALLANEIGIDILVILTETDYVYLNFNSPDPQPIKSATAEEMTGWMQAGHFAEGSMRPKVEAVIRFLNNGGQKAIIANLYNLPQALDGRTGTHVRPGQRPRGQVSS